jgi:hypothetical protein|tara:strand:- start:817 stop:987 length:171 start_codon:yes stop_codon:yes gene_type:complete
MDGLVQKLCLQRFAPKIRQAADHIMSAHPLLATAAQAAQQEHVKADFAIISTAAAA